MTAEHPEQSMVQLPTQPLGVHIMHHACEIAGGEYYCGVPDDVEWDLYDTTDASNIVAVNTKTTRDGKTEIHVHADITGSQSRRVARATRFNPPAYENRDVMIGVTATWRPTEDIAPETSLSVEVIEGGFAEPPGYDPMEDEL